MKKLAYLIKDITNYGKLMQMCIKNDICVRGTYWDEREKGDRCYSIDWEEKTCYYSNRKWYEYQGYTIQEPLFYVDEYGNYNITDDFDTWLKNQPEGTFVQGGGIDKEIFPNNDKKD